MNERHSTTNIWPQVYFMWHKYKLVQCFYLLKVASVNKSPVRHFLYRRTIPTSIFRTNHLWALFTQNMWGGGINCGNCSKQRTSDWQRAQWFWWGGKDVSRCCAELHTPANITRGSVISLLTRACSKTSLRETNFRLCVFLFTRLQRNMLTQNKSLADRIR